MSNVIDILAGNPKTTNEAIYSFDEWSGKALDLIGKTRADIEDNNATKESLLSALIKLSVLVFDMSLTPEEWAFMNPTDAEFEKWGRSLTPEQMKSFKAHMNQSDAELNEVEHD